MVQIADRPLVELHRVQRLAVSLNISNPLCRDRFKLSKWKFSNGHFQLDPTTFLVTQSEQKGEGENVETPGLFWEVLFLNNR